MKGLAIKSIDVRQTRHLRGVGAETFVEDLTAQLSALTEQLMQRSPGTEFAHYLCSSTFDIVCSGSWFEPKNLCHELTQETGITTSYSNAMQCASWGSLLYQHLNHKPFCRDVILSIMDANPLDMRFWDENQSWGNTSHRLTQIHVHIPESVDVSRPSSILELTRCNPDVILYEYSAEIQRVAHRFNEHTICLPYFESKMRKGLKRTLRDFPHVPDQYEQYGHVCGSDPWISVVTDHQKGAAQNKQYLLSSLASHGYVCFLSAYTTPDTYINLEE